MELKTDLFECLGSLEAPTTVSCLYHFCLCVQSLWETLVLTAVSCRTHLRTIDRGLRKMHNNTSHRCPARFVSEAEQTWGWHSYCSMRLRHWELRPQGCSSVGLQLHLWISDKSATWTCAFPTGLLDCYRKHNSRTARKLKIHWLELQFFLRDKNVYSKIKLPW